MVALHGVTVVGLGDPVMDVLVRLGSPEELSALGLEAGGCLPVSEDQMQGLLDVVGQGSRCELAPHSGHACICMLVRQSRGMLDTIYSLL